MLLVFFSAAGTYFSYQRAINEAEKITNSVSDYFELVRIKFVPARLPDSKFISFYWLITYANPYGFDIEFQIYAPFFGGKITTNPRNLTERLNSFGKNHTRYEKLPAVKIKELKEVLLKYRWPTALLERVGFVSIQASSLVSGSAYYELEYLYEEHLKSYGVEIEAMSNHHEGMSAVSVNSSYYEIVNKEEQEKLYANNDFSKITPLSVSRFYNMVNDLLKKSNSNKALYAVGDNNNLFGVFLSKSEFEEINNNSIKVQYYNPYTP